jgi:SAM-dependent methyltransferase
MTEEPFRTEYAGQYDAIYREKDYEAECDLLEAAFARYGSAQVRSVVDLGCGTGNHAFPLSRRGYRVTAVDRSAEMLDVARGKASQMRTGEGGVRPVFIQGDIRTFEQAQEYDAALMMFAVLGYQLGNDDVLAALRTVRRHLRRSGLLLFDVWFGPAVLAIRPSNQLKLIEIPAGKLIRFASTNLDVNRHSAEVKIQTWRCAAGREVFESTEIHQMRFFFPQELALFMSVAGLDLVSLSAMPSLDRCAGEGTWNAFVIGRAK